MVLERMCLNSFEDYCLFHLSIMEILQWLFEGVGSAVISAILGLIIGGAAGYRIGIKKTKINQKQKAGDKSSQIQIGISDGRE